MADHLNSQPQGQFSSTSDPQSGLASPSSFVSNSFVPFSFLAKELRLQLFYLKSELSRLINRDCDSIISLSKSIVDMTCSVEGIRVPVLEFRGRVEEYRKELSVALESLKDGLREKAEVEKGRKVLELLLDTFHIISNVEKLIKKLPSMPTDGLITNNVSSDNDTTMEDGTISRETHSILLEGIASEINRLKFYYNMTKNIPCIKQMENRIQTAMVFLNDSLDRCFINAMKHRDASVVYNCLRAFAAISNTTAAEESFRTTIVAPMLHKIIPYSQTRVIDGTSSNGLEADYIKIKKFIEQECNFLLEIFSSANSGLHVFDFLGNSILKEVLFAIKMGKSGVFSFGRPTEFQMNYKSSLSFLAFLEGHCPSTNCVRKLRSGTVYVDFMRQWNVGAYCSLRCQEIAGSLDSLLNVTSITPEENKKTINDKLTLKQSIILLESLRSCWSDNVIIISSSDKFLCLSLQLLSRYSTWLSSALAAHNEESKQSKSPSSTEWAINTHIEDFIYVIHDLKYLVTEIEGAYLTHVLQVLESCPIEVIDIVKQSILRAKKSLEEWLPVLMDKIIEAIVKLSIEGLGQLKRIRETLRMSSKFPVRHSPYVSRILRPLKIFLEGDNIYLLTESHKTELKLETATRITARYYDLAENIVNLSKKTDTTLQRLHQCSKRRGRNSDTGGSTACETDKIRMQLFLDIKEYRRNLVAMGIEVTSVRNIQPLRSFWKLMAPEDKQAEIDSFSF